jgi:hypothetical protein
VKTREKRKKDGRIRVFHDLHSGQGFVGCRRRLHRIHLDEIGQPTKNPYLLSRVAWLVIPIRLHPNIGPRPSLRHRPLDQSWSLYRQFLSSKHPPSLVPRRRGFPELLWYVVRTGSLGRATGRNRYRLTAGDATASYSPIAMRANSLHAVKPQEGADISTSPAWAC